MSILPKCSTTTRIPLYANCRKEIMCMRDYVGDGVRKESSFDKFRNKSQSNTIYFDD